MIRRSITLHDPDYAALRELADRRRTSVSQLVREALVEYLNRSPISGSLHAARMWQALEGRDR